MAVSPRLELLQLTEAQAQKASAVNIAVDGLSRALADNYVLDTSNAATVSYSYALPYDNSNDLSVRTALRFIVLEVLAGSDAPVTVIHPNSRHFFYAINSMNQSLRLVTPTNPAAVTVPANSVRPVYCNGSAMLLLQS